MVAVADALDSCTAVIGQPEGMAQWEVHEGEKQSPAGGLTTSGGMTS